MAYTEREISQVPMLTVGNCYFTLVPEHLNAAFSATFSEGSVGLWLALAVGIGICL